MRQNLSSAIWSKTTQRHVGLPGDSHTLIIRIIIEGTATKKGPEADFVALGSKSVSYSEVNLLDALGYIHLTD
jgi:hypothetical protein